MHVHAALFDDPDVRTRVEPTLVLVRPNLWEFRDREDDRPLGLMPSTSPRPLDMGPTCEWTLLPEGMADRSGRIHASKAGLHGILRARYGMRMGRRIRPGRHLLDRFDGTECWVSHEPSMVDAVRTRLDTLESFDRRLARFGRETGALPQVMDDTRDGCRLLTGAVTGDTSRLPGGWKRIEHAAVDARAVDMEARAALAALDPPGAGWHRIPAAGRPSTRTVGRASDPPSGPHAAKAAPAIGTGACHSRTTRAGVRRDRPMGRPVRRPVGGVDGSGRMSGARTPQGGAPEGAASWNVSPS